MMSKYIAICPKCGSSNLESDSWFICNECKHKFDWDKTEYEKE